MHLAITSGSDSSLALDYRARYQLFVSMIVYVRSTYDSGLQRAKITIGNIVS